MENKYAQGEFVVINKVDDKIILFHIIGAYYKLIIICCYIQVLLFLLFINIHMY